MEGLKPFLPLPPEGSNYPSYKESEERFHLYWVGGWEEKPVGWGFIPLKLPILTE
jgi:hypothetical protein